MSQPSTNPPILVGRRVRIVRAVVGTPVNHEGHVGKIVDVAAQGRDYLVELGEGMNGRQVWVPRTHLEMVQEDADHLDAIEARVLAESRARRTYDTARSFEQMHMQIIGEGMLVTARVAFVPKGGA